MEIIREFKETKKLSVSHSDELLNELNYIDERLHRVASLLVCLDSAVSNDDVDQGHIAFSLDQIRELVDVVLSWMECLVQNWSFQATNLNCIYMQNKIENADKGM